MSTNRMTRVNELLRREIASCLYRMLDASEVNLASITILRVDTSPDLRQARIYVSVLGDEQEHQRTMRALVRKRKDIQQEVCKHVVLKYTPHFHFELDHSVEEGDRVLQILAELGIEKNDEAEESDAGPATP